MTPTAPAAKSLVAVASTGKDAERFRTRPISTRTPWVVMRLAQGGAPYASLPDLQPGDGLLVSAELEVTTDCAKRQPDCVKRPYRYAPRVECCLLLARTGGSAAAQAGKAIRLGPPQRRSVTHERHHDVFVFDSVEYVVPASGLPWSGKSYLNLALAAWHPQAKTGHALILGQHNPGGTVSGDMSSLSVARFRPATQPMPSPLRSTQLQTRALPVRKGERGVVYSQRLDKLKTGEQLRVRANVKTSTAHLGYPARVTTEVLLSEDPTSTDPGNEAKRVVPDRPQLCLSNGKNCLPTDNPMSSPKVGAIRIAKDAKGPLYVNVTVTTGDPLGRAAVGDQLAILDGGFVAVSRYPASAAG